MLKSQLWECNCGTEKTDDKDFPDCRLCSETCCSDCTHECERCHCKGCEKCMMWTVNGWVCNEDCEQELLKEVAAADAEYDEALAEARAKGFSSLMEEAQRRAV